MRVLKPETELEKLESENTTFLTSHFYDKKIHFPAMWDVKIYPGVSVLKKSIEILKSGLYSPPIFRERVLFNSTDSAPEFWKDLYWLTCYNDRKIAIEELILDEKRRFENNPYKDDILTKKRNNEDVDGLQEELNELNEIIELSKVFRTLINEKFTGLEKEFAQRLQRFEKETERKKEIAEIKLKQPAHVNQQSESETNKQNETSENPHPRIFKESKHFQLFDYLRANIKKRFQLAELSFIYWQMVKDGFIYEGVKSIEYIKWLSETYEIELDQIKQLHTCNTGSKLQNYQTAKLHFQC